MTDQLDIFATLDAPAARQTTASERRAPTISAHCHQFGRSITSPSGRGFDLRIPKPRKA